MRWLFLILTVTLVHCKPQNNHDRDSIPKPNVEVERQDIIKVPANSMPIFDTLSRRRVDEKTKEILEKIAAVNKQQGLTNKKKSNYFQFPFSYSRSQDAVQARRINDFKLPTDPFRNPILDYLNQRHAESGEIEPNVKVTENSNVRTVDAHDNAELTREDVVPGQYIKRKIVHQQTYLMPHLSPPTNNYPTYDQFGANYYQPANVPIYYAYNQPLANSNIKLEQAKLKQNVTGKTQTKTNQLEKYTIDNIRNIILNTPVRQAPFDSQKPVPYQDYYQGVQPVFERASDPININGQYFIYGPHVIPYNADNRPGRQWQSPLAQYFPIVFKDPLVQMFNAVTSMVEFGPQGGGPGGGGAAPPTACKGKGKIGLAHADKDIQANRKGKVQHRMHYSVINENNNPEITIGNGEFDYSGLQVSKPLELTDLNISNSKVNPVEISFDFKLPTTRKAKFKSENAKQLSANNNGDESSPSRTAIRHNIVNILSTANRLTKIPEVTKTMPPRYTTTSRIPVTTKYPRSGISPPPRDQYLFEDEKLDDDEEKEYEDEKADGVEVSHDGNKKLFSKDNTGSGIFIHKLRVREGGVAIAGPGGIATAGSGGTAIVGPNGFAFTHPDSLAIAGSGSQVIAVDPTVSLGDIIRQNTTRIGVNFRPPRIGKVVAVGPVIYYNKG